MNVTTVNVQNNPFHSPQKFRHVASDKNSFEKYGFYAWGNEKKTTLNSNYVKFNNADEAKEFVKKNVDLTNCSFEDYWIASRILHENKVLDSKQHWKTSIPIGLMLRNLPRVTNPIYTRYYDNAKHNWIAHFYEYSCKDKRLGDLESASSLKEAADIFSELV